MLALVLAPAPEPGSGSESELRGGLRPGRIFTPPTTTADIVLPGDAWRPSSSPFPVVSAVSLSAGAVPRSGVRRRCRRRRLCWPPVVASVSPCALHGRGSALIPTGTAGEPAAAPATPPSPVGRVEVFKPVSTLVAVVVIVAALASGAAHVTCATSHFGEARGAPRCALLPLLSRPPAGTRGRLVTALGRAPHLRSRSADGQRSGDLSARVLLSLRLRGGGRGRRRRRRQRRRRCGRRRRRRGTHRRDERLVPAGPGSPREVLGDPGGTVHGVLTFFWVFTRKI